MCTLTVVCVSTKRSFNEEKLENGEEITFGSHYSIADHPGCEDFVICRPTSDR